MKKHSQDYPPRYSNILKETITRNLNAISK